MLHCPLRLPAPLRCHLLLLRLLLILVAAAAAAASLAASGIDNAGLHTVQLSKCLQQAPHEWQHSHAYHKHALSTG